LLEIVTSKLESESPKVAAKNKADSLSAPHKARRVEAESQGSKVGEIYTQNIEKKRFWYKQGLPRGWPHGLKN
jgi:hypothetical protein